MNSLHGRYGRFEPTTGGDPPPPERPRAPGPGGGGGGGARRVHGLAWLVLGAVFVAVERLAMLVFTVPNRTPGAYLAASLVLTALWVSGVVLGGIAFGRAWRRAHRP